MSLPSARPGTWSRPRTGTNVAEVLKRASKRAKHRTKRFLKRRFRRSSDGFDAPGIWLPGLKLTGASTEAVDPQALSIVRPRAAFRNGVAGNLLRPAAARATAREGGLARRPRPSARTRPADAAQRTLRVALRAVEAARVHHAEMAEREVVLHGIVGVERAQRRRDIARHRPAGARIAREPQAAADADHVRVERHDELCRRHAPPDAEIQRVPAHHPTQEQIQPLASRPGGRARKEIADARARRHAAVSRL